MKKNSDQSLNKSIKIENEKFGPISINLRIFFMILLVNTTFIAVLRDIFLPSNLIPVLILFLTVLISPWIGKRLEWKLSEQIKRRVLILSAAIIGWGRLIQLYPETPIQGAVNSIYPIHIAGMFLVFLGWGIFMGLIPPILELTPEKRERKIKNISMQNEQQIIKFGIDTPGIFILSFLSAYPFNLSLRLLGIENNIILQVLIIIITLFLSVKIADVKGDIRQYDNKSTESDDSNDEKGRIEESNRVIRLLWRFLLIIRIWGVFMVISLPLSYPELPSYQMGISYGNTVIIFVISFTLPLVYLIINAERLKRIQRSYFIIGDILSLTLFGSYLFFPPGTKATLPIYILICIYSPLHLFDSYNRLVRLYRTQRNVSRSLSEQSSRTGFNPAWTLLGATVLPFLIRIILIERHIPYLFHIIWGIILIIDLIIPFMPKINMELEENTGDYPQADIGDQTGANNVKPLKKRIISEINNSIKLSGEQYIALSLLFFIFIPTFVGMIYVNVPKLFNPDLIIEEEARQKEVWASLYTWYGVPGGPAGKYGLPQFDGSSLNWSTGESSISNVEITEQIDNPACPCNSGITYSYKGTAQSAGDALVLSHIRNNFMTTRIRTYFEFNISTGSPSLGPIMFQIIFGDKIYNTILIDENYESNRFYTINKVFPLHFDNQSIGELNESEFSERYGGIYKLNDSSEVELRIVQRANAAGELNISLNYLEISRWKHYNEDYHTVPDENEPEYWHNDPPVFKATAHSVFFNSSDPSNPWPEIETYGIYNHSKWNEVPAEKAIQFGLYDSLDPVVIRSQLRLMEKGGIDAVQIMHPWGLDIVKEIFDVAISINSNLTFFLYGSMDPGYISRVMENFAYNELYKDYYYRINGRPVYNYGMTGDPNKIPLSSYENYVKQVKQMYPEIYLIGDGFSSPYSFKEEFLDILDGWYYYDTSAFYRHGWGDDRIPNYQADGSLKNNRWNQLDRVFGQIATIAHSKHKSYTAIVIPGTDNTVVHGFIGSPLYDGRTGTINERVDGLTFNRTWESAIQAGADYVDIVSWNELHEGTEIEPTLEYGIQYILLNAYWSEQFKNA